jgi:predicted membrane-bound mannosyltransferase/sugar lactone lactonase YvrE
MHGPFLFHVTALSYWLLGVNDFVARVPVALLGIVLIILPYFMRPWLGRVGGIFTSFLFLISPYLLYYSRYIRHDIFAIVSSLLVMLALWYYLDRKEEKYLWLFAGALSWLFTTKEVSFIYVAIFGSFLLIRLVPQILTAVWLPKIRPALLWPLVILLIGLILVGTGYVGRKAVSSTPVATPTPESTEPFAADPETDTAVTPTETPENSTEITFRWVMLAGVITASVGLLLGVGAARPFLDNYPEFDLIMLFSTLLLPLVSPLLMVIVGWNPTDYNLATCFLEGQEAMTPLQLALTRLISPSWWSCAISSGIMRILFFVILSLIASLIIGLWWNRRRWLIAAAIFYTIFLVLYTSVFTNPNGLVTGTVGSLGYWLEQQEVQRGSQPWFYYIFVTPFYEFLPFLFSLLAIRLWLIGERLNKIVGYWVVVVLLAWFAFSLTNWWFNAQAIAIGQETSYLPGGLVAGLVLIGGALLFYFVRVRQIKAGYDMTGESLFGLFRWQIVCDFMPFLVWWLALTWVAYSYAGEKMPWLSTHFVIPMALLSGWYFNEKLQGIDPRRLFSKEALLFWLVSVTAVVAFCLAFGPIILGTVPLGDQQLTTLKTVGRVLGGLVTAGLLVWLWLKVRERLADGRLRSAVWSLSIFAVLALLTVRFAYMASFPNADYVREYMVYAHGAPAAKSIVLDQISELSQRLYGDNSIKVAYGGSGVAWPFTWYMRQYPGSVYFGETPSASLQDSPVIIAGRSSWDQADNVLGNDYSYKTYTYLWWPMEDYRQINWNAILGDPSLPEDSVKRGLGNPDVRQAIWDIWFYRNFAKYDQTFGRTHTDNQWPLRDELRLYIRNDVMAQLWDHGISPVSVETVAEPFTEGELPVSPALVLHEAGFPGAGPGELLAPRDMTVAPDGTIFVLDSGNQRVQAFAPDGTLLSEFGGPGSGPGEFSADGQGPWGIAADEEFVYVADTWNHRVEKFTHDGDFVASFGQPGDISQAVDQGLGLFFGPRDIVLLDDGRMLVTDTGNHRVQILDRDGNFLGQIGGQNGMSGANLGFFYEPVGVTVDPNGFVYVADTWNGRVQQFTPEFFPVSEWPVTSWEDNFSINNKPYAAADSAGRIYVTDPENFRILIFSPTGSYLGKFGHFGTDANSLALPTGIFIDAEDNIYVADAGNNRILKYPPIFAPALSPVEAEEEPAVEEPVQVEPTASGEVEEEDTAVEETSPTPEPTETEAEPTSSRATPTASAAAPTVSPTPTVPD